MSILIKLFFMFCKLSAFSFGGGYVMIPIMQKELERNGLANPSELTEVIAIAGMSPGPVAVNASVGMGYKVAGLPGVVAAFLGVALPCAVIVILAATFFFKVHKHKYVKAALYGLRAVITGIILYAAVYSIAHKNGIIFAEPVKLLQNGINIYAIGYHLFELKSLILATTVFIMLVKTKIHPVFLIIGSGLLGIIVF